MAIGQMSCDSIPSQLISQLPSACLDLLGEEIIVEGTLATMTFDNSIIDGTRRYEVVGNRFALIKDVETACDFSSISLGRVWGDKVLGVEFTPAWYEQNNVLPSNGTRLRISGVFRMSIWNKNIVPIIGDISAIDITPSLNASSDVTLGGYQFGEVCRSDMECDDNLICDRISNLCINSPGFMSRGSAWHGMNGACSTDDECPLGQICYQQLTIDDDDGEYSVINLIDQDKGKHICIPEDGESMESLCPRIGTSADLAGERFVTGKEVCIKGKVIIAARSHADGETHVQLKVDNPGAYPETTDRYETWGATTEIPPQYKNPILGSHVVGVPEKGEDIIVLGTYRFDEKHGWFEVHPVKAWWLDE